MAYNEHMIVKKLLVLTPLFMLSACDWVDSTGRGSNSAPVTQITFADGQSTEASVLIEENSLTLSVSASDPDGEINRYQWLPQPLAQGNLNQCAGIDGFNLAVESLDAACTSDINCAVTFEQLQGDGEGAEFMITAPELRAPVGVTYQLDAIDNDGGTGSQQSTFCLIAMNEAPDAQDDTFTVVEGQVLTVTAGPGQVHLLSNDKEHDHIANNALSVITQPVSGPTSGTSFSLQSDGGFTYAAPVFADRGTVSIVDTFVYSVTDGNDFSEATVTINVVGKNDPPELIAQIPLQQVAIGVEFESDLSAFFFDEEGADLSFAITSGSLPASGSLTLSPTGILSGTAVPIDEGNYAIELVAFDGSEQVRANVSISVVENLPVEVVPIAGQVNELGEVLELDLADYFTDPEGAPLTYKVVSQFSSATINLDENTGELTATFPTVGTFTIEVSASDGINIPTTLRISVTVSSDNVGPVFRGSYGNRVATVGEPITPVISGFLGFSDADNDVLTYTISGTLPDGLTLRANGVVFGIPTEAGNFPNIRFIATDPFGEFAISNAFRIRVLPAVITPDGVPLIEPSEN